MKFLLLSVLTIIGTNSANAYITSLNQEGAAPWKKNSFASPPANVELDDVFRQEYQAWANQYGKSTDDETRFENFKLNYMLQMQQNKRTGQFAELNEFGDMTAEEFQSGTPATSYYSDKSAKESPPSTTATNYLSDTYAKVSPPSTTAPYTGATAATPAEDSSDERVVEVELVDSIPSVRPFGSSSIPRKTVFEDTRPSSPSNYSNREYRQRPQKVNVDWSPSKPRETYHTSRPEKVNVNWSPSKPRESYHTSRPEKVNVDWSPSKPRDYFYNVEPKKKVRYHSPLDPSGPRVYRQDQPPPAAPRRKRRLYRVTPDQIL